MTKKDLKEQIRLIVNADHWDPFQVLGMHINVNGDQRLRGNHGIRKLLMPENRPFSILVPRDPD